MANEMLGAMAHIRGNGDNPDLRGTVLFEPDGDRTLVTADITGLPENETGFYGFHIHEGSECGGDGFPETGEHLNPEGMPHPRHMGDLPPLLRSGNGAYMAIRTDRFRVADVVGKTVVIHADPDDLTTQPSGNSGAKIACGEIRGM